MSRLAITALCALSLGLFSACTPEEPGASDNADTDAEAGSPALVREDTATSSDALDPDCYRRSGGFAWHCAGPIPNMYCTQIIEPSDPDTWSDNFFCSDNYVGMQWSFSGPIYGLDCTQTYEYADSHTWLDNYLCVPGSSEYHFAWSSAGPIAGLDCIQWIEPADPDTWSDNYICPIRKW